jgi:glycosyltransferase involved in cell wall biosynthesis
VGWRERQLLARLKKVFRRVTVINGYDRRQLSEIAPQIDVNIVPSIWRETFNQVGYELLCMGTPSLLSSSVGLRMFYENKPEFEFEAGHHADVAAKMVAFARRPESVAAFWDTPVHLPDMAGHADALVKILLAK